jgi:glycosyltransferase involved in cell wall biosynthesis
VNPDARLPRVVACMPAYKAAAFIEPVLESLAAQTYANLEVLVSVDVCGDGTAEICERFAASHANFGVIRQTERRGWIGNSNALLAAADGDFAFFAFHDDPLMPRYVERLVQAFSGHPDAVVAFSDVDTNEGPMSYPNLDGLTDRFTRFKTLMVSYGAWWLPLRGLMRMDAVRRLGGLERLVYGEYASDWPWLLRLSLLGEFVRVPERLIHKEIRPGGLVASWKWDIRNDLAIQLAWASIIRRAGFSPWQTLVLYSELGFLKNGLRSILRRGHRRLDGH